MTNNRKRVGQLGALVISRPMQEYMREQGFGRLLDEVSSVHAAYKKEQASYQPTNYEARSPEELAKLKQRYQGLLRRIAMAEAVGIAAEV